MAAERANDVEAWSRYTVDDFPSTTPDGRVDTKAERANLIRNRERADSAALIEEPKVELMWRMYGTRRSRRSDGTMRRPSGVLFVSRKCG